MRPAEAALQQLQQALRTRQAAPLMRACDELAKSLPHLCAQDGPALQEAQIFLSFFVRYFSNSDSVHSSYTGQAHAPSHDIIALV